jgi:tRNA pseudouridine55 synthase
LPSGAAQRDIPPDIVHPSSSLPPTFDDGAALLVDKPTGMTSYDVVAVVRRDTSVRKVGHAGTLDPMATGLLIILVARPATRLQAAFMHLPKTYRGTMRFGERTPSHDTETEVEERTDVAGLTRADIERHRDWFTGMIEQVPPMYSAVQVDGERLYEKARRGETVDRPPRQVRIDSLVFHDWSPPDLTFSMTCSKGTYVRSLARDLGEAVDVGAHLTALRRTEIGAYAVADAWSLSALSSALSDRTSNRDEA